jgi:cytochrome oxidase assembly protein ShyY1
MKRIPVLATIVVALAIMTMIALGVWQLQRRGEKEAAIAQLAANAGRAVIAFPNPPVGDETLFRQATATCLRVLSWRGQSGRDATGTPGWRQIAECATGAEGPGLIVQFGVSSDPNARPRFAGGEVSGYISHAPSTRPILADVFGAKPKQLMLVAGTPLPGLRPNPAPDLSAVPNNHLAYAVQWFLFAGLAAIIYALALRRRTPNPSSPRP